MYSNKINILLRAFISVIIVYLIFMPIFFMYNFYGLSWIYIPATAIRFITIAFLGIWYGKKYNNIIDINKYKTMQLFAFIGLASWIFLHLFGVQDKIFGTLSSSLGIYDILDDRLFLYILWEQLLHSHLITNFLICISIVFFTPYVHKIKRKLYK